MSKAGGRTSKVVASISRWKPRSRSRTSRSGCRTQNLKGRISSLDLDPRGRNFDCENAKFQAHGWTVDVVTSKSELRGRKLKDESSRLELRIWNFGTSRMKSCISRSNREIGIMNLQFDCSKVKFVVGMSNLDESTQRSGFRTLKFERAV